MGKRAGTDIGAVLGMTEDEIRNANIEANTATIQWATQMLRGMREDDAVFSAATLDVIRDVAEIAVSEEDADTRTRRVAELVMRFERTLESRPHGQVPS
jgi:hypothetical protein